MCMSACAARLRAHVPAVVALQGLKCCLSVMARPILALAATDSCCLPRHPLQDWAQRPSVGRHIQV